MAQFIVRGDSMAHRVGDYLCVGGVLAMICLGAMGCGKSQTATYLGNRQFSPELVARARKILRGPVVEAWELGYDWFPGQLVRFSTDQDRHVVFVRKNGNYVQVHRKDDYSVLNEILSHYTFTRDDFRDPDRVAFFLGLVVGFWEGPDRYEGTSVLIRVLENCGALSNWLEAREKDERVFRDLCRDPAFIFEQEKWTVTWNVFRIDGSVDEWRAAGEFDTKTQTNRIQAIAIRRVKPPGTFSAGMLG